MDAATPLRADEDDAANCNTAAANTAMTSNSLSVLELFAVLWADDGLLAAWASGTEKWEEMNDRDGIYYYYYDHCGMNF